MSRRDSSRAGVPVKMPYSLVKNLKEYFDLTKPDQKRDFEEIKDLKSSWEKNEDIVITFRADEMGRESVVNCIKFLTEFIKTSKDLHINRMFKKNLKELELWMEVLDNPLSTKITRLKPLERALIKLIKTTKNYFVFKASEDGQLLPYLVTKIEYHAAYKDSYGNKMPEYVEMNVSYASLGSAYVEGKNSRRGSGDSSSWYNYDIGGGVTASEALVQKGYFLESDDLLLGYETSLEVFHKYKLQVGKQFLGIGKGYSNNSSWYSGYVESLSIEDTPQKLVIDAIFKKDTDEDEMNDDIFRAHYTDCLLKKDEDMIEDEDGEEIILSPAKRKKLKKEEEESEADLLRTMVPYHPYLKMFSLDLHRFYNVHVNCLAEYVYKPELLEKLILPKDHKDLIEVLIDASTTALDDIIKGKSTGVIVMSTGPAGVGKTLTAEVFSEFAKRPLYKVQSSQLGADIEKLEKTLKTVLSRANRWKAILLIDEADVYVYERGDNLIQNAIVGIFLRVLEYYKGILFMTSNRAVIIDDAILSRVTAHVRYDYPAAEDLKSIWKVQSELLKANLDDDVIDEVVERFPKISGRDARNILRLAKIIARKRKTKVTLPLLEMASKFQDLTAIEEEARTEYLESKKK